MLKQSEDALICDFAETYHILDWRSLSVKTAATLACGLRDDSRIKMLISGTRYKADTLLLAGIADRLSILAWMKTKDGQKGRNKPRMLVDEMTRVRKPRDTVSYGTPEEYLAARARIVERITNGRN